MSSLHEFFEGAAAVTGDLAIVGLVSAWWYELFANDAHLLAIWLILILAGLRVISACFHILWQIRRWRQPP